PRAWRRSGVTLRAVNDRVALEGAGLLVQDGIGVRVVEEEHGGDLAGALERHRHEVARSGDLPEAAPGRAVRIEGVNGGVRPAVVEDEANLRGPGEEAVLPGAAAVAERVDVDEPRHVEHGAR